MKPILITLAALLLALVTLAYTLPIYTLGVLLSNIDLLPSALDKIIGISIVATIALAGFIVLVGKDFVNILSDVKRWLTAFIVVILVSLAIKPFIPKDKETAMVLIGAQVLYDSDTARSVATQGADLLKRSVNVFATKLKQYEKSLESNTTKE